MTAMPPPTLQQLALLNDDELHDLAALWRKQAARGVRPAFGMAHALEVECRRRAREGSVEVQPVRAAQAAVGQNWWSRLLQLLPASNPAGNKKGLGMSAESLMLPEKAW